MGLTIGYTLRFDGRSVEDVRNRIEQLRKRALDLPFKKVGDILDLNGPECDFQQCRRDDPNHWLLIQARHMFEQDNYGYRQRQWEAADFRHYPNASTAVELRPHQKTSVARNMVESNLVAHPVGSGKTYVYATTATGLQDRAFTHADELTQQRRRLDQVMTELENSANPPGTLVKVEDDLQAA